MGALLGEGDQSHRIVQLKLADCGFLGLPVKHVYYSDLFRL